MTTLDQIKQALFTATNITDALTKLDALGVAYRECAVCDETFHLLQEDVTFWAPRSNRVTAIHVCIGDTIATVEYREAFFAQQQPDLSKSVPAHDSPAAAGHPFLCDSELKLVQQYRAEKGFRHGYVVLFFLPSDQSAEITGWKLELDNPSGFVPGVVAVDPNFMCWESVDGDDYNGAKQWQPLLHEETKQFFQVAGGAA